MGRGGSGGGGSRGGGGFSSGSSRSSRGFSSSSGSRGGSRPSSSPRPSSGPRPGNGPRMPIGGGPRFTPPPPRPRGPVFYTPVRPARRRSGGCLTSIISLIIVMMILMIMFSVFSRGSGYHDNYGGGSSTIVSSVEREPLPSGSVNETDYFTDHLGWINTSSKLTSGMKKFYKETGVQPYLYLASDNEVFQAGSLEQLANGLYDQLFTDEAHFLFTYHEDDAGEWEMWFVTGTQATAVIDNEAEEIIYQYFVRYYDDYSLSEEELFSKVFEDSAALMMKHTTNGFDVAKVAVMIVGGVAIVAVVVYGVNKSKKIKLEREKEQNEFTEKMMNVPLEKFSESETDKELSDLMDKYKDSSSGGK